MSLLVIVIGSAVVLGLAYGLYGGLLARLLGLDPRATTPAVALRDDVDYVPLGRGSLLNQHFAAIAAAGPIVGPILAGALFGWLPALLWIVIGSIFVGGVHDLTALTASVRHRARSIAEVVREHMSRRAYVLFLLFIWLALIYVVVAFTDITASSFVGLKTLENGDVVSGGGIATSSLLYLALPLLMGIVLRLRLMSLGVATLVFLPLAGVSIWAGQFIPLDVGELLNVGPAQAQKVWSVALLVYCFAASLIPMWLLLQPRGHLGGYFMFVALLGGMLGLVLSGESVKYPAFIGWQGAGGQPLFPLLFITIACGACSGFHALVASGTTSKQLRTETDARPVAYGGMLLEGMVAVVSLCCVMLLAPSSPLLRNVEPNLLYANGLGVFLSKLGVPLALAVAFGLMAFTTFVYDTLDVCTRLGRYVAQELLGWPGAVGRCVGTGLTVLVPLAFLLYEPVQEGKIVPTWKVFWNLFGASNQLLAALTLIGITVWLQRTRGGAWVWWVTGLPAALMYAMSMWELVRNVRRGFDHSLGDPVAWIALVLIGLAALMLIEAVRLFVVRPASVAAPT